MTTWTNTAKATGTSWSDVNQPTNIIITPGMPIGMLLALTYASSTGIAWNDVAQASGTVWTNIAKAT